MRKCQVRLPRKLKNKYKSEFRKKYLPKGRIYLHRLLDYRTGLHSIFCFSAWRGRFYTNNALISAIIKKETNY